MLSRRADMPDIPINWNYFPFMPQIQNAAGGVLAVVLVICVIALAIGGLVLAISKLSGSNGMSEKTVSILLWILGVAAVVGAAVGLVGWASGLLVW